MKTVTVRDLQKRVKACVDDAQRDRVIVTRHGKPAAVLVGVQGEDWDAVVVQTDPKFWKLLAGLTVLRRSAYPVAEL